MVKTNYVTEEQFKRALKEVAEQGQNVWYLMGRLQVMFGLDNDKETDDSMHKIIANEIYKENK
jgi:hypothetical protein